MSESTSPAPSAERSGEPDSKGGTPEEVASRQFQSFSNQVVCTMGEIAKLTDMRVSTFLYSIGTTALVLAILLKVKLLGAFVTDLSPSEFVSLVVLSLVLLAGGTFLRIYQQQLTTMTTRLITETGTHMAEVASRRLERGQDVSARIFSEVQKQQDRPTC